MTDELTALRARVAAREPNMDRDVAVALFDWWRARHHGTSEEEREAEEALNEFIHDRIEEIRALVAGQPTPDPRDARIEALEAALRLILTCDPAEDAAWCHGIAQSALGEDHG